MRGPACTTDNPHTCDCSYHRWLYHDEAIEPADRDNNEEY